jgi:leucyl-tRNA synthetase
MDFNHKEIEAKWKSEWKTKGIYKVKEDPNKEKYYVLDMFPYPSGAGLHVGHPLGYIASDIFSRYKRLMGFNVLHPMGFDAFGLPAEEYAIQTGIHPAVSTSQNIVRYKEQFGDLGLSFDWDRQVSTCEPQYYKWTQWIFSEIFEHYYDLDQDKAVSITKLRETFAAEGNTKINAVHDHENSFSAEEWNKKSHVDQEEIIMDYRLAYKKIGYVNWCEELGTVLANDQVKDGLSERGGHPVEQKAMSQWYLRITAYAERLLQDMNDIEWSDALKTMQRNWIGKSEGASISFQIKNSEENIEVFTTRPDTIFGATFMVLAPKHELVTQLVTEENKPAVDEYISYVNGRSELERISEKKVTGAPLGAYVINPFNQKRIPIWISEYVLKDYGTGAIMAVPSDDERDHAFATKFGLEIIPVVDKSAHEGASKSDKIGTMINSDFLDGMKVKQAIKTMFYKVKEIGVGQKETNYRLRDANFSRQRYWGEPFPIVYSKDGIAEVLPESELPLVLPDTEDFKPGKGGQSPLSRLKEWNTLPDGRTRETDVMPAVAGSSWYFLRYMDPNNDQEFASQEAINYWKDVDLYIGGAEHAVAHLLYARFWHKFLFDTGRVPTNEPFKKLINQGMIQGVIEFIYMLREKVDGVAKFFCAGLAQKMEDTAFVKIPIHIDFVINYGSEQSYLNKKSIDKFLAWRPEYEGAIFECSKGTYQNGKFMPNGNHTDSELVTHSEVGKMSKSKFNVINPDDVVGKYGADCFRMYEMFLGPIEQSKPWDMNGIDGVSKFIRKFWNLYHDAEGSFVVSEESANKEELKILHTAIKKMHNDVPNFSFNTAVSQFMVCTNELKKLNCNKKEVLEPLVRLLAPFAPFLTEELWHKLGNTDSVHLSSYPIHNEEYLKESAVMMPLSINGKKRSEIMVDVNLDKETVQKLALADESIQKWTEGKEVVKVIVVPKRMVNIVVKA